MTTTMFPTGAAHVIVNVRKVTGFPPPKQPLFTLHMFKSSCWTKSILDSGNRQVPERMNEEENITQT